MLVSYKLIYKTFLTKRLAISFKVCYSIDTGKGKPKSLNTNIKKGFYIMRNTITFTILGTDDMQKVITDLLATSEQAYNFIITLNKVLESEPQQATTKDLSNFARFIEDFNGLDNYYASELLYMLDLAFKEVED